MILSALAGIVLLLAFLALVGRADERNTLDRWDMTLTPKGHQTFSMVAEDIGAQRDMGDGCFEDAEHHNGRGDLGEALRLLDLGVDFAVDRASGLRTLLANVSVLATHAAAMAPMSPLWPRSFNGRQLATLAGLHAVSHHLLITTRERLVLRIAVLRFAARIAARAVGAAVTRLTRRMDDQREWKRLDEAGGDLGTVTDESLETLRLVLASLAAVRRPVSVRERKTA